MASTSPSSCSRRRWGSTSASRCRRASSTASARLWAGILRGEGLSRTARAELVRPQVPITSAHQSPTLAPETDPANTAIELSAGLGLVTFQGAQGQVWFKGGHNDCTGNMLVCVEQVRRCLVLLANDVRAERLYPDLVRAVLGETGLPWSWEHH